MELYASSWNCMQANETACKLMELHATSWNYSKELKTTVKPLRADFSINNAINPTNLCAK